PNLHQRRSEFPADASPAHVSSQFNESIRIPKNQSGKIYIFRMSSDMISGLVFASVGSERQRHGQTAVRRRKNHNSRFVRSPLTNDTPQRPLRDGIWCVCMCQRNCRLFLVD
ncbi:hypothetical protein GWI33_012287, partial [Rhynchophorus ferrugineus]